MDDFDFSGVETNSSASSLDLLATMAATLRQYTAAAQRAAELSDISAHRLFIFQTVTLPEAMQAAGVTAFKLADGAELEVKPDLKTSIPKDHALEAYAWLRANEHGAAIKVDYIVDVRAATDKERAKIKAAVLKAAPGLFVEESQSVHSSTLKSLVKELLGEGKILPPCFSVYEFKKAALKEPKVK